MATETMEGKTALELLAMGSKSYWAKNYTDAAAFLSRSSEMLVEEHKDDKHNSLGNVYLYYGKALLELAREDGDPLGDAVPKEIEVEEEVSDEEDDQDAEEEGAADKEPKNGNEEKEEGGSDKQEIEENKTDDAKAANISINGEAASSTLDDSNVEEDGEEDAAEDAGEGGSGEKTEEEEPTDLQLAWEVLELGKVILERRGDEGKEDFADCLVTLGEVSLESENFDSAIADITAGLEIQKQIYTESKDMRKLAETYYKLGMALSAHNKIDEGIANYEATVKILKDRLKVLEEKENPGSSDAEEIRDIKILAPELEEKIADLKNYKEEANTKPDEEQPVVSSPEKKANNISHLVKRKRKLEDVAEEAAQNAAKKAAL